MNKSMTPKSVAFMIGTPTGRFDVDPRARMPAPASPDTVPRHGIAHEAIEGISAVTANAQACQNWLAMERPDVQRALLSVSRVLRDVDALSQVILRARKYLEL